MPRQIETLGRRNVAGGEARNGALRRGKVSKNRALFRKSESCVFHQGSRHKDSTSSPRLNVYQASKVIGPFPMTCIATTCSTDVGPCERRQHVSLAHFSSSMPRKGLFGSLLQRIRPRTSSAHRSTHDKGHCCQKHAPGQLNLAASPSD